MARLDAANAELEGLADVRQQLAQRDARIASLEARVEEQDRQVVSISRQLVAREVYIQELEARLASQDLWLAHRDAERAAAEIYAAAASRRPDSDAGSGAIAASNADGGEAWSERCAESSGRPSNVAAAGAAESADVASSTEADLWL